MMYDYLIVGQGLAGTIVGYTLLQKNKSIVMIDQTQGDGCSQIAAGILNPVTGKRQVITWLADKLFPFLFQFYPQMEHTLSSKFFYPIPIYHPFESIEQQNTWIAQSASPQWRDFIFDNLIDITDYQNLIHNYYLGGWIGNWTGYIDVPTMLKSFELEKNPRKTIIRTNFEYNLLKIHTDWVEWQGIKARKIIFCEGKQALQNPFFPHLPFNLVKGEVLDLALKQELEIHQIINQGIFILPLNKRTIRVGATYQWHNLDLTITEQARKELTQKLDKIFKPRYEIIDQKAGIRPATKDRRPIIGLHKTYTNMAIFNGLGSKGASLAPYFAHIFTDFLEGNTTEFTIWQSVLNPYRFERNELDK
ncbi:MAG: FAD-binding oxidoreductase [Microscillaceae bacterium]|nr:FAD-binding oxidoreductase [Microscillaceae bacterium]MDW8460732.1 FAD-dependent oxidoreductase [Cytophagales bacterium]